MCKNSHKFWEINIRVIPIMTTICMYTTVLLNSHSAKTKYQKGTGYMGVKVFNKLPICIKKEFNNSKEFKHSLKNFLKEKSFYSLQKYFELISIRIIKKN
jgi:hypothetical protein